LRPYGKPDHVLKESEIVNRSVDNPIFALQSKIPGLTITAEGTAIMRGSNTSSFTGKNSVQLMVNGMPTNSVGDISINNVASIEVVNRISVVLGAKGANGIINIITKDFGFETKNIDSKYTNTFVLPLHGYSEKHKFQQNATQPIWEPYGKINANGSFDIDLNLTKGRYLLQIVGVLNSGNLIKCNKIIVAK
jgi:hypothetical protein